jgi:CPA1 family monovalent cation:H+ antiporter
LRDAVILWLILVVVVTMVGALARRFRLPEPIALVAAGLLLGLWQVLPRVELQPSLFFALFLPPLLYADGWLTNLREFRKVLRPILLLSIGLVVFTTIVVGYVVHALVPAIPLAVAFALGAIVSPTDAVATEAILDRVGAPLRIRTILSGESLVNDASGLVAFRFAVAAVLSGSFDAGEAALEFLLVAFGGATIGLGVAWISAAVRRTLQRHGDDEGLVGVTLSLLTPFAAVLPADALGLSGVLAAVVAGLYNGWSDPIQMTAQVRAAAWSVWSIVLFLLNGLVFLLLGLQLPVLFDDLRGEWWTALVAYAVVVSLLVMALRLVWVFPGAYLPRILVRRIRESEPEPGWRGVFVVGWGGLRGAVTMAAALSIPVFLPGGEPFPARSYVIFFAASVILSTLLLQGLSLPWVVRELGVRVDRELVEEEHRARVAVKEAQIEKLRELETVCGERGDPAIVARLESELTERLERLALADDDSETPTAQRRARERELREELVAAGRERLVALYHAETINDEIFRTVQSELDVEEARLRAL